MYDRTITPVYEQVGKRRRLVGFLAKYGDFEVGTFDNYGDAERAIDHWVAAQLGI